MQRSPGLRNAPSKLSKSVHHQLSMYALAASAAGVGVLALSSPAQAKIVYTPVNVPLKDYYLDLNHDGIADFFFWGTANSWSCGSSTACVTALVSVYSSPPPNAVAGKSGAAALWPGVEIGPNRVWKRGLGRKIEADKCHFHPSWTGTCKFYGPWANGISGKGFKGHYLGLKFLINGKVHYGWARLNTTGGPSNALLTGYAYETIPGKAIIAGQTEGPDETSFEAPNASLTTPAPEPATLGVLAMGAHGLSESRY